MKSKEEIDRFVRLELEKSDLSNKTQAQIDSYVSELYLMAGWFVIIRQNANLSSL